MKAEKEGDTPSHPHDRQAHFGVYVLVAGVACMIIPLLMSSLIAAYFKDCNHLPVVLEGTGLTLVISGLFTACAFSKADHSRSPLKDVEREKDEND